MKEAEILRYCLRYLRHKNYYFGRVNVGGIKRGDVWCKNPYNLTGVPDIIGFYETKNGMVMFGIECKSSTGRLSPAQEKFKEYFQKSGNLYIVARDLDDVINIF